MSSRSRRMPNFTVAEENVLRSLTAIYKDHIEEKGSNARVWGRKSQAWLQIEKQFFKETNIQRSAARLKSKYEMLKKHNKLQIVVKEENNNRKTAPNEESLQSVAEELPTATSQHQLKEQSKEISLSPQSLVIDLKNESPSTTGEFNEEKGNSIMSPDINDDPAGGLKASLNQLNTGPDTENINYLNMPKINKSADILQIIRLPSKPSSGPDDNVPSTSTQVSRSGTKSHPKPELKVPKQEPNSPPEVHTPIGASSGLQASRSDSGIDENNNTNMSLENQLFQQQITYYRNKEKRDQHQYFAELQNLDIQRKIYKEELKIKRLEYKKKKKQTK